MLCAASSRFLLQLLLTESWRGQGAACLCSCAAVNSLVQLCNKASLDLGAVGAASFSVCWFCLAQGRMHVEDRA